MQTRLISGNRDTLLFSINSLSLEYPSSPFLRESCFLESLHVAWPMRTNPIRALSVLRRWLSVVVPMCLRSSGVNVQCAPVFRTFSPGVISHCTFHINASSPFQIISLEPKYITPALFVAVRLHRGGWLIRGYCTFNLNNLT